MKSSQEIFAMNSYSYKRILLYQKRLWRPSRGPIIFLILIWCFCIVVLFSPINDAWMRIFVPACVVCPIYAMFSQEYYLRKKMRCDRCGNLVWGDKKKFFHNISEDDVTLTKCRCCGEPFLWLCSEEEKNCLDKMNDESVDGV